MDNLLSYLVTTLIIEGAPAPMRRVVVPQGLLHAGSPDIVVALGIRGEERTDVYPAVDELAAEGQVRQRVSVEVHEALQRICRAHVA